MSIEHTITERCQVGNRTIERTQELEYGAGSSIDEVIADGANNAAVTFTLDVSACKSMVILATGGNILLETNDGSSPVDTLSLVDGKPYFWNVNSYHALVFDTDITALYFTNSSGEDVRVQIETLSDPTP